jgi:DNA polymerase-1
MLIEADLKAIEWYVCAALTEDPLMIQELWDGVDPHGATCVNLMEMELTKDNRQGAKLFNFRALYCDEKSAPYAFYMDSKMPDFTQKKWDNICDGFFSKYRVFSSVHKDWVKEVNKTGCIIGPTGRKWTFDKHLKKGGYHAYNKAQIYNYPVQGTSGDIIKLAMVYVRKRLKGLPVYLINTVHDSLILDGRDEVSCYEAGKICLETFHEIPDLVRRHFGWSMGVPITGEISMGHSWGSTQEVKFL